MTSIFSAKPAPSSLVEMLTESEACLNSIDKSIKETDNDHELAETMAENAFTNNEKVVAYQARIQVTQDLNRIRADMAVLHMLIDSMFDEVWNMGLKRNSDDTDASS